MADKHIGQTVTPSREEQQLSRRDQSRELAHPFQLFDRFADEMDRLFDDFGFGFSRGSLAPRFGRLQRPLSGYGMQGLQSWSPQIEVFQRSNELVVRADLPGLTKDDIKVDITDEAITIEGERKQHREEEREGVYRSERVYGTFHRVIPIPEGAMADQAKAVFKNGVLELTMPAPNEQVRRGRRVEITEGAVTSSSSRQQETAGAGGKK